MARKCKGTKPPARKRKLRLVVSAKAKARRGHSWHTIQRKVHKQSGIEAIVEGWLLELGIPYKSEHAISRTHVDFFLPPQTVLEVQGCYWHSCPVCNPTSSLTKQQLRWRRRDARRFTFLTNAGYHLMLLWEHQIVKDPKGAKDRLMGYAKAA